LNKNYNTFDQPEGDGVIINRLKDQLIDLYKDIELNYSRLYFKNPLLNHMLKMMAKTLKMFAESLEFPVEMEHQDKPYTKKDKFSFGTSRKDFS